MTDLGRRELMTRARKWVRANDCPLPLDLTVELMAAGLDADAIEDQLLNGNEDEREENREI